MTSDLKVTHIMFRKPANKTVTTRRSEGWLRRHKQLDYILVTNRLRDDVINAESDTKANTNAGNIPATDAVNIRLRRKR